MSFIAQFVASNGYFGTSAATIIGTSIVLWLLVSNREWMKRMWKLYIGAAMLPGPPALPLVGNALLFACSHDEILPKLIALFQQYDRPFRFWLGPRLMVGITNPRDIELILTSSIAAQKSSEYHLLASFMGLGVATDTGPFQRGQRKLVMPMLNGNKVLRNYFENFERQSRRFVKCLEERVDTGEFDIMHYVGNFTLDVILETLMGTPGTAQQDGYKDWFTRSIRAHHSTFERILKVWLHSDLIYYRTTVGKQYAEDMKFLHNFTDTVIDQKKKEYQASQTDSEYDGKSSVAVLERLIAHNEKTKLMDDKRLRDEINNLCVPAQDPMSLACSFLLVMLGMHPAVQDKVRAEVQDVIGGDNITLEHISKLKYLDMVCKETIRLFPIGPLIMRELKDDLNLGTCTAPKGCTIILFLFMTHRDPNHWTEPDKFIPERFTPENSNGRHPYAFVPFSNGMRGCIGQNYAMTNLKTLVAKVIQTYRFSSEGSLEKLRLNWSVSIRSMDGYNVSITRV